MLCRYTLDCIDHTAASKNKIEKKIPLFATTQSVCCYVDSDDEANMAMLKMWPVLKIQRKISLTFLWFHPFINQAKTVSSSRRKFPPFFISTQT